MSVPAPSGCRRRRAGGRMLRGGSQLGAGSGTSTSVSTQPGTVSPCVEQQVVALGRHLDVGRRPPDPRGSRPRRAAPRPARTVRPSESCTLFEQDEHPAAESQRGQARGDARPRCRSSEDWFMAMSVRLGRPDGAGEDQTGGLRGQGLRPRRGRAAARVRPAARSTSMESRLQGVKPLPPATMTSGPSLPGRSAGSARRGSPAARPVSTSPPMSTWRATASSSAWLRAEAPRRPGRASPSRDRRRRRDSRRPARLRRRAASLQHLAVARGRRPPTAARRPG